MADPNTPDPTHVHRGAVALTTVLRISTLLPARTSSCDGRRASRTRTPFDAGLLQTIITTYRRALAELAR